MNNLITESKHIPIDEPIQTISINPVTLHPDFRALPLELRITAPIKGKNLPIIVFSHGHGPSSHYIPSKDTYGPLVNFYARHGFVVIQPTHLNSRVAGLPADAPDGPLFWESRPKDMSYIIDSLDQIEDLAPAIAGRLDHAKIAAVGHSLGGQTVGMLLGAQLTDLKNPEHTNVSLVDTRVKAGVLLASPGNGGAGLTKIALERYSFMNPDFSTMNTPTLVVAGDQDESSHITVRGPEWHFDPFKFGPGSDALLVLKGGKHGLGGIAGYDAKETDDEDPDRLAVTQRMTWAYLKSALNAGDTSWKVACDALKTHASTHAHVECK
ncbi:MAG: chlorophyllase [OCS116 cluster bacterium]|uniref:Chlorophyllase n=1 Tax=OCS116 cluster bacterium TaxID=2030921 RepID=A0A2A4YSY9_9PROT|nr:chlorophyllase [OCS116 cluster bacterium]